MKPGSPSVGKVPPRPAAEVTTVTINCMALRDTRDVYTVLLAECMAAVTFKGGLCLFAGLGLWQF